MKIQIAANHHYIGQVDSMGKPNGIGRMTMRGSALYEGHFQKGLRDGWGRLYFSNGSFYQGVFKENAFCGQGELRVAYPDRQLMKLTLYNQRNLKLRMHDL